MRLHPMMVSLALACSVTALGACGDSGGTDTSSNGGSASAGSTTSDDGDSGGATSSNAESTGGVDGGSASSGGEPTTGVDGSSGGSGEGGSSTGTDPTTGGDATTGGMADCAGMSFSTLSSESNDFDTRLQVSGAVSCNPDITLTATGATVCIVDDGDGGYYFTVETVSFDDFPPQDCGGFAEVGLSNISIVNTGNGMEVTVDQNGGTTMGDQPITVLGDVQGTALGTTIDPTPISDFNGHLPPATVTFGTGNVTATYDDIETVLATAMPMVGSTIPVTVTVTLTGLHGSFTLDM